MSTLDVSDLRPTIVPKSDQLNAEQLLGGPMTIEVTDVRIGGAEQPISVHYVGENGRPYRPCKTMRKVLILAWGPDGREWAGKSMTLYNDPNVKFGGDEVGGIRISHMSDIPANIVVSLTATRGKKALHTIKLLKPAQRGPGLAAVLEAIERATNKATMDNAKAMAQLLTGDDDIKTALAAYKARASVLKGGAPKTEDAPKATAQQFIDRMDNAFDAEEAQRILAEAKEQLTAEQFTEAEVSFQAAWTP